MWKGSKARWGALRKEIRYFLYERTGLVIGVMSVCLLLGICFRVESPVNSLAEASLAKGLRNVEPPSCKPALVYLPLLVRAEQSPAGEIQLLRDTEPLVLPTRWNASLTPRKGLLNPSLNDLDHYFPPSITLSPKSGLPPAALELGEPQPGGILKDKLAELFKHYGQADFKEDALRPPLTGLRISCSLLASLSSSPPAWSVAELKASSEPLAGHILFTSSELAGLPLFEPLQLLVLKYPEGAVRSVLPASSLPEASFGSGLLAMRLQEWVEQAELLPGYYLLTVGL